MKKTSNQFADTVIARAKNARMRRRIVAVLSVVVLLFTMNRTIFPADAMEGEPKCGIPEHVHAEACYDAEGALSCEIAEHTHTDACYDDDDEAEELPGLTSERVEEPVGEEEQTLGEEPEIQEEIGEAGEEAENPVYEYEIGDRSPVYLSDILMAVGLEVSGIEQVGQVVDDAHPGDMIRIEETEEGTAIYAAREFDSVELAVITDDDIYSIRLRDAKLPETEPEADGAAEEEQTEVGDEETEASEEQMVWETEEEEAEAEIVNEHKEEETEAEIVNEPEQEETEEEPEQKEAEKETEEEPEQKETEEEPEQKEAEEEAAEEPEQEETEEEAAEEPEQEETEGEAAEEPEQEETEEEAAEEPEQEETEEEAAEEPEQEEPEHEETEEETEEESEEEPDQEEIEENEETEEVSEEEAAPRFEAHIDIAEMPAPISLRALMAEADRIAPAAEAIVEADEHTEETDEPEAAAPAEEAPVEDDAAEAEPEDSADGWLLDYDEALFAVERDGDDFAITPLDRFESAVIAVTTGDAEYALTLENLAAEADEEAEATPEAEETFAETPVRRELDLGLAVVTPVDEALGFDEDAAGTAALLSEAEAKAACAAVEDVLAPAEAIPETAEAAAAADEAPEAAVAAPEASIIAMSRVEYQAFSIGLENVDAEDYEEGFNVVVTLPEALNVGEAQLYHVLEDAEGGAVVEQVAMEEDAGDADALNAFAFTANSLDSRETYVLSYTVDFYYGEFEYHLDGEGSMLLSELFDVLEIDEDAAEATEVVFSTPELLRVARTENDWLLISLAPFDTEEALDVVMQNGNEYHIRVTDAQGSGYIQNFNIDETLTGSASFDGDDTRGNDSSAKNDIVRSYDIITYNTSAEIQSHSQSGGDENYLIYTFTVEDDDELELDLDSMGWAELTEGTNPVKSTVDGKDVKTYTLKTRQMVTLTGKKEVGFVLKVGNETEGFTIQPTISARVDGNETEISKQAPVTKVTSKPAYNVQLDLVDDLSGINYYTINGQTFQGAMAKFAFAVQMRNQEPNRGLKGIELPKTGENVTISFDIDLSAYYRKDTTSELNDLSTDFPLQLYSTEWNGQTTSMDHKLPASQTSDYAKESGVVYQNGDVTITQNGATLHVEIAHFGVDMDEFPKESSTGAVSFLNNDGQIGIGNISTYRFDLIQPTKWTYNGIEYDIQRDFGNNSANGTVTVNATVTNLTMESETGAKVGPGESDYKETVPGDNTQTTYRELYGGNATYDHQIFFSTKGDVNSGTNQSGSNKNNGKDSATIGANICFTAYYDEKGAGANRETARTVAYNQLVKFDNVALEPDANPLVSMGGNQQWETLTIQFVGKKDGWEHKGKEPWEIGYDDQQKAATEDSEYLYYYDTLDDLKRANMECVGLLLKWRGCSVSTDSDKMDIGHQLQLHVKNDPTLLQGDDNGNVISSYMLTMSTRAWTVQDVLNMNVTIPDDNNSGNPYTKYATFAQKLENQELFQLDAAHPHSVNVDRDKSYNKVRYDANGCIPPKEDDVYSPTAGFLHGDTLYIIPYTTTVTKHVAQKSGSDDKRAFDLDAKQRYVDFAITSSMKLGMETDVTNDDWKTVVTLTDTLPANLTYVQGSAYVDGTYAEQTPSAGIVTGGRPIEPTWEGGKMIFTLEDIPVQTGTLPTIHYSCFIGNVDYPAQDVVNNQSLTNAVSIQTKEDKRDIDSENGNYSEAGFKVVKTSAFNIQKYGTDSIELDGEGSFHLLVNNYTTNDIDNLCAIDFMPHNLEGTYRIKSLKLKTELLRAGDQSNTDDIRFYYATTETQLYKPGTTERAHYAAEIPLSQVRTWSEASFDQTTGAVTGMTDWPLAIAYVDAKMPALHVAHIVMEYQGNAGRISDKLVNEFKQGELLTSASADVYARNLSGVAWFDENLNGQIDNDEQLLSGVQVALYRLDGSGNITGDPVKTTQTLGDGSYTFGVIPESMTEAEIKENILYAGDYAIVFSGTSVAQFQDVTLKEAAGVETAINSKAEGRKTGDALQSAVIRRVHLMPINEMKTSAATAESHFQAVQYQNAGFIRKTSMTIDKKWQNVDGSALVWPEGRKIALTLNRDIEIGGKTQTDASFNAVGFIIGVNGLGATEEVKIGNYGLDISVTAEGDAYKIKIDGLPARNPANTASYVWRVTEAESLDYNTIYPDGKACVKDGDTLINRLIGYALPSTGGAGTLPYTLGGILLILGAAILLLNPDRRHNL